MRLRAFSTTTETSQTGLVSLCEYFYSARCTAILHLQPPTFTFDLQPSPLTFSSKQAVRTWVCLLASRPGENASDGFQSKRDTDLTIRSRGEQFHVHKLIVCAQSEFFSKACGPDSLFLEAKTGVVNLDDDHPFLVKLMLVYCYTGGVDEDMLKERFEQDLGEDFPCYEDGICNAEIYAFADKYWIDGLKTAAMTRLYRYFDEESEAVLEERYWWHERVSKIAQKVYKTTISTDRGLRDMVLNYTSTHFDKLMEVKIFKANTDKIEGFWAEFTQYQADNKARFRECPRCGTTSMQVFRTWGPHLINPSCHTSATCDWCDVASSFEAWNQPLHEREYSESSDSE
ncbi:hypothetical protein HDK64DRAFT_339807 [Phyllosticta capitalensis]